jgi:translation initiation factor IF-2
MAAKQVEVKEVTAATGVKISAKEIEEVVAGMPLRSASSLNIEEIKEEEFLKYLGEL